LACCSCPARLRSRWSARTQRISTPATSRPTVRAVSVSAGGIPSLAGMDAARMVLLMQEFRDGKRPATVMQQHAKGYTDAQIEAIAAWFAAQK
jgi:hypothetical protein